jgi:transaldolase / glucose-6-phosphate isomerase
METHVNPLKQLAERGQSVWLDYIRRGLIINGELNRLIDEDGLRGVTSNPAIFEKAIAGSNDYATELKAMKPVASTAAMSVYEQLAIRDIQDAADVMLPVYQATTRRDGYVSLEVSPYLAHDTQGTIEDARRLWTAVGRENVMIKVPATPEGVPALTQLISEGINVNATLLFLQGIYERIAEAYITGLERLVKAGGDPAKVASVASFFISRIDSNIDSAIAARLESANSPADKALLTATLGKVAIANARLTYNRYGEIYATARWAALAAKGAQTQRLLWASTSTKNPKYRDVMYVEELVGPDTVNTIPMGTLEAFREHGRVRLSLRENVEEAHDVMERLGRLGISMRETGEDLLTEGVRLFREAFDKLLDAVAKNAGVTSPDRLACKLPDRLTAALNAALDDWRANNKVRRLWARDASLWTNSDEADWLGWMAVTDDQLANIGHLRKIAEDVRHAGFANALLLGMGGSSLCPEVMKLTFGKIDGFPELFVLDSTDPAQIRAIEKKLDLANTLFIVSSKSGGTLEPNIFKQYFWERARQVVGADHVGRRFIAVTDPGSKIHHLAENEGFRHLFFGVPSIGGRYSALSDFGMVPSAVMGVDVPKFLDRAEVMVHACAPCMPPEMNAGVMLGAILGTGAANGRDKITFITSPRISDLGAWLEQLLAESTGKEGKGLIPVDREDIGHPSVYGDDRIFVYLRLDSASDAKQDAAIDALELAGQPVVRIALADTYDLAQEFFRWELATAVAGSIIGINSFNQPDVEASKVATRKLTAEYEQKGSLPVETPIVGDGNIKLYGDPRNAAALAEGSKEKSVAGYLRAHLARIKPGDYFALLAFIEMNGEHERALSTVRHLIRDHKRVATCLGFGPRFLHSTGQAYKGGPNSGVFLQVTCDDASDLAVPGQKYTFGIVKEAEARGDFEVLCQRGRRALRIHLGKDVGAGLRALETLVRQALA